MMLDLFCWSPDRATFLAGMQMAGFANPQPDGSISWFCNATTGAVEMQVDEIGPDPVPSKDAGGNPILVGGHHANLYGWGSLVDAMTAGLPQTDANGNLLSLFVRTHILTWVKDEEGNDLVWDALPSAGVPGGYKGPHGVILIDPAVVKTPFRVRA